MKIYELPRMLSQQALLEADALLRKDHEAGIFDAGDPNHPMYNGGINYTKCLGFAWDTLIAKQYRK